MSDKTTMPETDIFQHYEYSVIEVASYLAGYTKGTTDGFQLSDTLKRVAWLRWRLEGGWIEEQSRTYLGGCYDSVVRILGIHALALWDARFDSYGVSR